MARIEPDGNANLEQIRDQLHTLTPEQRNRVITDHGGKMTIDFAALTRLLWEHQIYEQADQSSKIDILRTIRNATESDDWITIDELKNIHNNLNESSIYRHIKSFREEGLVEQVGSQKSGLYAYTGP